MLGAGLVLRIAGLLLSVAAFVGRESGTAGWMGLHWSLDAVSAPFLVAAFLALGNRPGQVGAAALALLAGDGAVLLLALACCAALNPWLPHGAVRWGRVRTAVPVACLAVALLLLATAHGFTPGFAGLRAAAPDGGRATAVLVLTVIGALPFLRGAGGGLGVYLLCRVLIDLCGPAAPVWSGVPLLALGTAAAVWGSVRAASADDLRGGLGAAATAQAGLAVTGIGIAAAARGADLPPLAGLALSAALVLMLNAAVLGALLHLCAGAVARGVGGTALASLGGLARRMPGTVLAALVGAAGLAAVPPLAGFTGVWLLLQCLLAARFGGLAMQLVFAAALAGTGAASAVLAAAALRWVGLGFLGRPRSTAAAAAAEAPRAARLCMAALAGLVVLFGVVPGLVVVAVQPAVRLLGLAGLEDGHWLVLAPVPDGPVYAPLGMLGLLIGSAAAAVVLVRFAAVPGVSLVPVWEGGAARAGSLTAAYAPGLLQPLRAWHRVLDQMRPPGVRQLVGLLALVLAASAIWVAAR